MAAELTIRRYVAAITLRNARGMDIMATTSDGKRSLSIQVKTNSGGKPTWLLSSKSETFQSKSHFYVFVVLKELNTRPDFYIVPSSVVARTIHREHREWLALPKTDGTKRKDSSMRQFRDIKQKYLEQWQLLDL